MLLVGFKFDNYIMKKFKYLEEIQKRLPGDLILEDGTNFDFTEDEFIGILSWIKYLNLHYERYGKTKIIEIHTPLISKRIKLDFLYYSKACDNGKYKIYISANSYYVTKNIEKQPSVYELIRSFGL